MDTMNRLKVPGLKVSLEIAVLVILAAELSAAPTLTLETTDGNTGRPLPARFALEVNGVPFQPDDIGPHGVRFLSLHDSKKQLRVMTYTRGTFPVKIPLPEAAKEVTVFAAKGLEFLPIRKTYAIEGDGLKVNIPLKRWSSLSLEGWSSSDPHLHYDRFGRSSNLDWFIMMEGDDLESIHFMMLKGGKVPGEWGTQYAYGKEGEAREGARLITGGEEYRDSAQGHVNLLGIERIIPPIMAGQNGLPNFPFLRDVFLETRKLNGIGGIAHGGALGTKTTAALDVILGAADFMEIANTHLYVPELWYRLMNCGFFIPPVGGTDLPNYPMRDNWQPFLGEIRTYTKVDEDHDFDAWKNAVRSNRVFVTSGPMVSFKINDAELGDRVTLPDGGGEIEINATLSTPIGLTEMELLRNGEPVNAEIVKKKLGAVHLWRIKHKMTVSRSCWFAVRGKGVPIQSLDIPSLKKQSWSETSVIAHSAAIPVIVGDQRVSSREDKEWLIRHLGRQREFYETKARYWNKRQKERMLGYFDEAVKILRALE
jgi:hypothetical protein